MRDVQMPAPLAQQLDPAKGGEQFQHGRYRILEHMLLDVAAERLAEVGRPADHQFALVGLRQVDAQIGAVHHHIDHAAA
jgi:hypothetical protein